MKNANMTSFHVFGWIFVFHMHKYLMKVDEDIYLDFSIYYSVMPLAIWEFSNHIDNFFNSFINHRKLG